MFEKEESRRNVPGDVVEEWSHANVRVKVAIFFNMMEETDQLGLEAIVKLIRDITKFWVK